MTVAERDRNRLRQRIIDEAVIKTPILLSNGEKSDFYIDMRQVTLSWYGSTLVGRVMLNLVRDLDFDAVGGLTMGADPVAIAMMRVAASNSRPLDAFVVRKEPKAHGMAHRIEGPSVSGRSVLIVDDVVTTGASALMAVNTARHEGAEVVAVASVVRRGTAHLLATEAGVEYRTVLSLGDLGLVPAPPVKPTKWKWRDIVVSWNPKEDRAVLLCPGPDCDGWYVQPPEFSPSLELLQEYAKHHIKKVHRG